VKTIEDPAAMVAELTSRLVALVPSQEGHSEQLLRLRSSLGRHT
jgi:hypothetical protein